MKNKDFRFFDYSNLPEMSDALANTIVTEIGNELYKNEKQKALFKIKLIDLFGSKCAYCGAPLTILSSEQVDHFVPENEENQNDPKNLIVTCFSCNNAKRRNIFSHSLYPYDKAFSKRFKRDSFGFIVPTNSEDLDALYMAEKLHFSYLSKSIIYIFMLVDYLMAILEKKTSNQHYQLLKSLSTFKRKLEDCSKSMCLKEAIKR